MLTTNCKTNHIWCVLPVFNNKDTVKRIALECCKYFKNVVIVDDGSTDINFYQLFKNTDIPILKHNKNKGKGQAILTALDYIIQRKGRFMITIDADGQHYPHDLNKFIPLLQNDESRIIIGCRNFMIDNVPNKSRLGRKVANFWLRLESGVSLDDCQSGFRAYPVKHLNRLKLKGRRYEFETEVLAKAAWAGIELKGIPVDTKYDFKTERVSHYRPFLDTLRISFMHTRLIIRRLFPWPHKRLIKNKKNYFDFEMFRHPILFLKKLLRQETTPLGLAVAAGVGIFLGTLPLISIHTLIIIYVTTRLHLNKVMAVTIQHICMPPVVPIACIQLGHYMLHKEWIQEASFEVIFGQLGDRLYEWLLGSLLLAPLLAVVIGLIVFLLAQRLQGKNNV